MHVIEAKLEGNVRRAVGARRRLLGISGLVVMGTLAAACGSTASSTTTSGGSGGGSAAPASTAALVKTVVSSKLGTILVDSKGFTLYRFSKDSTNKSACSAACAKVWPPLLMTGSGSPVAGSGVTGLGTIAAAGGGRQVTYHGMPLYTFTADKSPGQVNGQDLTDSFGTWFVVATKGGSTATTAPSSGVTTTTSASSGGSGF
jgi:predicted lipoprotein with Yx(FWY)xxD motif